MGQGHAVHGGGVARRAAGFGHKGVHFFYAGRSLLPEGVARQHAALLHAVNQLPLAFFLPAHIPALCPLRLGGKGEQRPFRPQVLELIAERRLRFPRRHIHDGGVPVFSVIRKVPVEHDPVQPSVFFALSGGFAQGKQGVHFRFGHLISLLNGLPGDGHGPFAADSILFRVVQMLVSECGFVGGRAEISLFIHQQGKAVAIFGLLNGQPAGGGLPVRVHAVRRHFARHRPHAKFLVPGCGGGHFVHRFRRPAQNFRHVVFQHFHGVGFVNFPRRRLRAIPLGRL